MTTDRYLRRKEVPAFLREHLGVSVSENTLNKWACAGGGPPMAYYGRTPVYAESSVLAWGRSRITRSPTTLTAELEVA